MKERYPPKVQKAVSSLLTNPGECTPTLRQAIEAYTNNLSRGEQTDPAMPDELIPYVHKIIYHAYQITDADVQQIKDAGYSEDAIFEITLCATVGASLARFGAGFSAIQGV